MQFLKAIRDFYAGYANFTGRTSRSSYWLIVLYYFLVSPVILLIEGVQFTVEMGLPQIGPVTAVWVMVNLLPQYAIAVRRLHDVNRSGWVLLIPIYHFFVLITKGDQGPNKYGKKPL